MNIHGFLFGTNDIFMKYSFPKQESLVDGVVRICVVSAKEDDVVQSGEGRVDILLGVAEPEKMTRRKLVLLVRKGVMLAKARHAKRVVFSAADFHFLHLDISDRDLGELIATNMEMANFQFTEFLTEPEEGFAFVEQVSIVGASKSFQESIVRGTIIGEEVNACRRLANLPGGDVTPQTLADEVRRVAKEKGIVVKILEEKDMARLKMGGVLGVGKGSDVPAKFIIMEYRGGKKTEAPIVLVGKGVTFDTGGINLKPSESILGMNMDMSGGAAVIHSLALAARLGIRKNIVALVPAVENMPSGSSYRPGDILRSMSGKTIEVLNTDAEGRIILADALHYAKRYKPSLVIDVATLTGAALVALGERASAVFTRDQELEMKLREFGETSGDYVWPMPLWEEYDEEIRGTFGDVANLGRTKWGGAITAAAFLAQFATGYRWAHIDMAPRMTAIEGEFLAKGAAGAPVRLLLKIVEEM
ncbi:MAG: leucyl aminopeptidase [Candidatus Moraniibacteriota bacterium]